MFAQPLEQFSLVGGILFSNVWTVGNWIQVCMVILIAIIFWVVFIYKIALALDGLFGIFQLQLDFRGQVAFLFFCAYSLYIIISNLFGLMPGGSTITAQLFHNIVLSFILIVGLVILGLSKYHADFFKFFVPSNVPPVIVPFITALEILSFTIRIVSLALRLFANMVAGHTLLHVLHGFLALGIFVVGLSIIFVTKGILVFIPAYLIVAIITLFEIVVAAIQAYVFGLLFIVYFKDFYPAFIEEGESFNEEDTPEEEDKLFFI